jgi:hypothetical protein
MLSHSLLRLSNVHDEFELSKRYVCHRPACTSAANSHHIGTAYSTAGFRQVGRFSSTAWRLLQALPPNPKPFDLSNAQHRHAYEMTYIYRREQVLRESHLRSAASLSTSNSPSIPSNQKDGRANTTATGAEPCALTSCRVNWWVSCRTRSRRRFSYAANRCTGVRHSESILSIKTAKSLIALHSLSA